MRPCSAIFGPDDNFISETWIRAGALQIILPAPKIDYVHVDNVLWGHLLCELCTRRQFLAEWDADTMASCGECGAPLLADVWSQVRVLRPCKSAFGLASMSRGHTGI